MRPTIGPNTEQEAFQRMIENAKRSAWRDEVVLLDADGSPVEMTAEEEATMNAMPPRRKKSG